MTSEADFQPIGAFVSARASEGALTIIEDAQGRLLMQLRDLYEGIYWPGKWGLIGGGIEPGEDILTAGLREIKEETGLSLTPEMLTPFAKINSVSRSGSKLFIFRTRLAIRPCDIRLGEGAGFAFLTPAQLADIDILDSLVPVMQLYLEMKIEGPLYHMP